MGVSQYPGRKERVDIGVYTLDIPLDAPRPLQVLSLIRKKRYNVETITVGHTYVAGISRMTIGIITDSILERGLRPDASQSRGPGPQIAMKEAPVPEW